ncbi:uncharacterized protein HD556DRAFT_1340791 [Suillus plorans]|uniref:Glucose receptor Git3 N-terminal domain-containing protein n=1 Tax=Suillus plorans TaxID=116603 RepID=A0A9P7DR06_9AGAM|nr:uncharacterized protein HD556DRAFT_1340791 [Suillus plorans]KAG1800927.1 hypothetical protein HD556DRAFT_1340791 [Suillus plorans]
MGVGATICSLIIFLLEQPDTMANPLETATAFDFDDRLGLVFIVEAASLSVLAITTLLAYITYSAVTIRMGATRRWSTDTHVHYYFLNLMVFDLIQAIGGMFDIAWIDAAEIYPGTICTVQGAFKHVGNTGAAFSTITIALHTMQVLILRWSTPPKGALLGSAIIWIIVGLMVGIPNIIIDDFYGPTGHWCWIERNNFQRIGLQYMWMWFAAFITIVVYIFLALVVKRIVSIDGYKIRWASSEIRSITPSDGSDPRQRGDEGAIALRMLFYPAVYIITVLPITAARFTEFHTGKVPWGVTAWADTLLLLSGFFNTILYTLTRPKLLPRRRRSPSRVVLTSTGSNQFGRTNRFQNHKHYPYDTKPEDGVLPSTSFELTEPPRSSSELRFARPEISDIKQ